ncbi:MAG: PAC2 family protein [Nitrososphaerales archaeon]
MEVKTNISIQKRTDRVRLVASLPDMGHVGGLVTQFLVEHLKLKSFAEIISFDKPFVLCEDGLISEIPSTYKLNYSDKAKTVFMSGDSQPQDPKTALRTL